jgi:hypothetical protein
MFFKPGGHIFTRVRIVVVTFLKQIKIFTFVTESITLIKYTITGVEIQSKTISLKH